MGRSVSRRICHLCGARSHGQVCGKCLRIHGLPSDERHTPTLTGTTSIAVRRPLYERIYENQSFVVVWDGVRRPHPGEEQPR